MAIDKDTSIYRDRGTIGSADELDEYGVWVKSEPQELRGNNEGDSAVNEPALPDIEDLPDLDLDLDLDLENSGATDFSEIRMEPMSESVPDIPDFNSQESDFDNLMKKDDLTGFEDIGTLDMDSGETNPEEGSLNELSMEDFLNSSDEPVEGGSSVQAAHQEEELLDMDIDFSDGSDIPSLDASLNMVEEESTVELSSSNGTPEMIPTSRNEDFDDMQAFDNEVNVSRSNGKDSFPGQDNKMDLSTELLLRIANELSSIKNELSSLKNELTVLRAENRGPAETHTPEPDAAHGFFDEEEDETIALTGDELDNILNTADFTEEAGSDAGEEFESGLMGDDFQNKTNDFPEELLSDRDDLLGDIDISSGNETVSGNSTQDQEEPAFEQIELDDLESVILEAPSEIVELMENGVRSMTEAPEDTSYLEIDEVPPEALDLSDAVIDEPDLGGLTLEDHVMEEPSLDSIDIDLELDALNSMTNTSNNISFEETAFEESLHEEAQDLTTSDENLLLSDEIILSEEHFTPDVPELDELDTEIELGGEESFAKVVPEGFVVDAEEENQSLDLSEADEIETFDFDETDATSSPVEEIPSSFTENESNNREVLPANLRQEVKTVLSYMDQLLESLPESKIEEFARSEYFDTYKKLFEDLGLV